jgi:Fe-S cluster assembly protein SufD
MRHTLQIEHRGQNISSDIYGLFIAKGNQHIDTQSFIDHAQPHCESNELFKGILLERGRGVFNGKIIVRQDAQKINAYQQNAALVLSKDAVMDSKPQLEIYADDVRCSHGATIGQLDPEALFYLKARGLNDSSAKALLKKAFLKDVVDQFPDEKIAEYIMQFVDAELLAISQKV